MGSWIGDQSRTNIGNTALAKELSRTPMRECYGSKQSSKPLYISCGEVGVTWGHKSSARWPRTNKCMGQQSLALVSRLLAVAPGSVERNRFCLPRWIGMGAAEITPKHKASHPMFPLKCVAIEVFLFFFWAFSLSNFWTPVVIYCLVSFTVEVKCKFLCIGQ